jgi:2-iminobutanoate/2-iminopropanoate deaminase/2-aminomuconate deaminase
MSTFERLDPEPDKIDYLPYAPAVVVPAGSEYFFLSGATGIPLYHAHPHLPEECVLPDDAAEQTRRAMVTITELLEWLGLDWSNVVHTYEFVTDMRDTGAIHTAMGEVLGPQTWTPASTLIGVNSLSAPGARIELDVIAARPPRGDVPARPVPADLSVAGHGTIGSVASDEELLWMSGSTAIDFYHHHPHIEDEEDVPYRASGQVEKILRMFDPALESMGVGWPDVVKLYQWATDSRDIPAFDAGIDAHLPALPAATTVDITSLSGPPARLELEFVATRGPKPTPGAEKTEPAPVVEVLHPQPQLAHLLPYAPAVHVADATLHFLSGVGPLPFGERGPLPDDIVEQTKMLIANLDAQLAALGLGWSNVVKSIQMVTDIREADTIGATLAERYGTSWTPAGTLIQVDALPVSGARIQLDIIVAG